MKLKKILLSVVLAVLIYDFVFTVTGLDIIPIGNYVNDSDIHAYEVNLLYLSCTESWSCGSWSSCNSSEKQARTCSDGNVCGTLGSQPALEQNCTLAEGGGGIGKFFTDYENKTADEVSIVGDVIKFELDQTRKAILYSTLFIVIMVSIVLVVTKKKDIDLTRFFKK